MAFKQLKLYFDKELAVLLADKINVINPGFPTNHFIKAIAKKTASLELKDRVELIADELHEKLGNSYSENTTLLLQILGPENEEETGMFKTFYWVMPIAKYVEKYGLNDFDVSIKAIEEITKRNTGEYAIRPFLEKYPDKTMTVMKKWSTNKNRHVRRLSCEGLRPRLPWAKKMDKFIEDPTPILPVLESLKDDLSKYVQNSVANCLNDILKDNFYIGKELIEKWKVNPTTECQWVIKHAMRNLLKAENDWARMVLTEIKPR